MDWSKTCTLSISRSAHHGWKLRITLFCLVNSGWWKRLGDVWETAWHSCRGLMQTAQELGEYSQECCWLVTGYSWIWLIPATLLNSSGWLFPVFPRNSCVAASACSLHSFFLPAVLKYKCLCMFYFTFQGHSSKWSEKVVGWATKSGWNSKLTYHWNVHSNELTMHLHCNSIKWE